MKMLFRLLLGLSVTACFASANGEVSNVAFELGQHQFKSGDGIVIEQVLANSPKLNVGDKVVVRGRYRLTSTTQAKLGLFVTHRSRAAADNIAPSQVTQVSGENGTFELSCEITYAGNIHVSFYPASEGETFGGVYFTMSAPSS